MFEWRVAIEALPPLVAGFGVSLQVTACAIVTVMVGGPIGAMLLSTHRTTRNLALAISGTFRSPPFLILVYLAYFGLPKLGLSVQPFEVGVATLGLYGAAHFSQIVRAGLLSVPPNQSAAARALGFTERQVLRHVKFQQALVLVIPPSVGLAITLLKETSVLSVISLAEATYQSNLISAATYAYAEVLCATALIYWLVSVAFTTVGEFIEARATYWLAPASSKNHSSTTS